MQLLELPLVLVAQSDQRPHVHLLEGGQHGGGVLGLLEALRDPLPHAGHLHASLGTVAGRHHWRGRGLGGWCGSLHRGSRGLRGCCGGCRGGRSGGLDRGCNRGRGSDRGRGSNGGALPRCQCEQRVAHLYLRPLLCEHLRDGACLGGAHLHVHLVRLDHRHHLVHLHPVPRLDLPAGQHAGGDGLPHDRHIHHHRLHLSSCCLGGCGGCLVAQ
mmetsp:Transcript_8427/g.18508  ORF Transcript_8427/g.18508 Transcript_8427/m.18508 type:complete len:214 (-) Transcript_8427:552-1193(-)